MDNENTKPPATFYRWLKQNHAEPARMNVWFVRWQWIALVVFVTLHLHPLYTGITSYNYDSPIPKFFDTLMLFPFYFICAIPLFMIFIDFFYYLPLAYAQAYDSGFFRSNPALPPYKIFSGLRGFIVIQNLKRFMVPLIFLALAFAEIYFFHPTEHPSMRQPYAYSSATEQSPILYLVQYLIIAVVPLFTWYFLLELGVASVLIPRRVIFLSVLLVPLAVLLEGICFYYGWTLYEHLVYPDFNEYMYGYDTLSYQMVTLVRLLVLSIPLFLLSIIIRWATPPIFSHLRKIAASKVIPNAC